MAISIGQNEFIVYSLYSFLLCSSFALGERGGSRVSEYGGSAPREVRANVFQSIALTLQLLYCKVGMCPTIAGRLPAPPSREPRSCCKIPRYCILTLARSSLASGFRHILCERSSCTHWTLRTNCEIRHGPWLSPYCPFEATATFFALVKGLVSCLTRTAIVNCIF